MDNPEMDFLELFNNSPPTISSPTISPVEISTLSHIHPPETLKNSQTDTPSDIEKLNAEKLLIITNYEQQIHTLETQNIKNTTLISSLNCKLESLTSTNQQLSSETQKSSSEIQELQFQITTLKKQQLNHQQLLSTSDTEKRNLYALNLQQQNEITLLNDQISTFQSQISSLRHELSLSAHQLTDVQSSDSKIKSDIALHQHQITLLNKNNNWLNEELQRTCAEFNEYRREKSDQILQLQTLFEQTSQEKNTLEIKSFSLEKKITELEPKLESFVEKVKYTQDMMNISEAQFKSEMSSQKRLAELYQNQIAQAQDTIQELTGAVQDFENKLYELSMENDSIKSNSQADIEAFQEQLNAKDSEITNIKNELQKANELMGQSSETSGQGLGMLSPSALVASKFQKTGKTFTQVYAEYTKLQEDFLREKRESARLKELLDSIMTELQERAPVFESYREDLENSRLEIEKLSNELNKALSEKDQCSKQLSELSNQSNMTMLENNSLIQESKDQSRQIQGLLRQIEAMRSGDSVGIRALEQASFQRIVENGDEGMGMDTIESESEALITEKLVVFRNIEELQSQNQTLRRTVRNLSKKMEDIEVEQNRQREELLSNEMEDATKVIAELQAQMNIQSLKLETLIRERDQWKTIADSRSKNSPSKGFVASRASTPAADPVGYNSEIQLLNKELQRDFDIYRKESNANISLLKQQIESINNEKMDLTIQSARLGTQVQYQSERYKLLVESTSMQSNEIAALRDKLSNTMSNLTRQESKIQEYNISLQEARQNTEILRNENQQLKIEHEVWKASESRAVKACEDLSNERNSLTDRLREVQHMYDDKERMFTSDRKRLDERLEESQKELQQTRKQLSDLMDEHRSMSARHDLENKDTQFKLQNLMTSLEKAKGELSLSQNKEAVLEEKVNDLNLRVKSSEEKIEIYEGRSKHAANAVESTSPEDLIKTLELKLNQCKFEITTLQEELKLEKERVETFKGIGQANEERLAELNSTYDLYKSEMDGELEKSKEAVLNLEKERDEIKERLNSTIQEVTLTQEKIDAKQLEFNQQVRVLEINLENAKKSESVALDQHAEMKADLEIHANIAKESQKNYEREVIAHSDSLQALSKLKEETSSLKSVLADTEQRLMVANSALSSIKASSELVKHEMETEIENLKSRANDLYNQNALLHSQFEQLQVSHRHASDNLSIDEPQQGAVSEKVMEELRDVVRFLRREKEIVQTRLDLALQESERATIQVNHLQKSLDETRAILDEERLRTQDVQGTKKKHQELLEKIEQANLLRESNVTLRDQLETCNKKLADIEAQLHISKEQIEPLKEEVLNLKSDLSVREDEVTGLKADNERWKLRTQQILEKYERIDPIEHNKLKEDVDHQKLEIDTLKKLIDENAMQLLEEQEKFKKLDVYARKIKSNFESKTQECTEKENEISKLKIEMESVNAAANQQELATLKADLEKAAKDRQILVQRSNNSIEKAKLKTADLISRNKLLESEIDLLKQKAAASPSIADLQTKHQEEMTAARVQTQQEVEMRWNLKYSLLQKQIEKYQNAVSEAESKHNLLKVELKQSKEELKLLKAQYNDLLASKTTSSEIDATSNISAKRPREEKPSIATLKKGKKLETNLAKESDPPSSKRLRVEAEEFVPGQKVSVEKEPVSVVSESFVDAEHEVEKQMELEIDQKNEELEESYLIFDNEEEDDDDEIGNPDIVDTLEDAPLEDNQEDLEEYEMAVNAEDIAEIIESDGEIIEADADAEDEYEDYESEINEDSNEMVEDEDSEIIGGKTAEEMLKPSEAILIESASVEKSAEIPMEEEIEIDSKAKEPETSEATMMAEIIPSVSPKEASSPPLRPVVSSKPISPILFSNSATSQNIPSTSLPPPKVIIQRAQTASKELAVASKLQGSKQLPVDQIKRKLAAAEQTELIRRKLAAEQATDTQSPSDVTKGVERRARISRTPIVGVTPNVNTGISRSANQILNRVAQQASPVTSVIGRGGKKIMRGGKSPRGSSRGRGSSHKE